MSKRNALALAVGGICIPHFEVESSVDTSFPGCCGIGVVYGFGTRSLSEYTAETLLDLFGVRDDPEEYIEEFDFSECEYTEIENPEYNLSPLRQTEGLTKKQARAWWDEYCKGMNVACLMASTIPTQKFVEENLEAAGWKRIGRSFESANSGRIITVWQYIRSDWVMM